MVPDDAQRRQPCRSSYQGRVHTADVWAGQREPSEVCENHWRGSEVRRSVRAGESWFRDNETGVWGTAVQSSVSAGCNPCKQCWLREWDRIRAAAGYRVCKPSCRAAGWDRAAWGRAYCSWGRGKTSGRGRSSCCSSCRTGSRRVTEWWKLWWLQWRW